MSYKILALLSLVALLSSCSANRLVVIPEDNFEYVEMDQEQDFEIVEDEEEAQKLNEQVEEIIEETVEQIEVSDRVFFDFNEYRISPEAGKILDTQAEWLASDPSIRIIIEGHCDERGTREYNIALGERRALSAKDYLVSKGINISRIKTVSYGKERPAFIGTGESIWSKNRRSVVVVQE